MNNKPTLVKLSCLLAAACLALAPTVQAVDPPPDGGYPGGNTAEGDDALLVLTSGEANTAIGFGTLSHNTTGNSNTALGFSALVSNTTGGGNTASGISALLSNTTGATNTAVGFSALFSNTDGDNNTAIGANALFNNTNGSNNIALGASAGINRTTSNNNIDIGNSGVAGESRAIRIGTRQTHRTTFIAGISGATVPAGVAVIVDTNGHLGTSTSSARYKEKIQPMDKSSEAILALKPVTFRYRHELDPDGIPQFGLVAEDVEKVNPALVARDEQGKPYTVRYEAVNAMLLNEFLKEHMKGREQDRKIDEQGARLAEQEEQIQALMAMVKEQAAQIQKVNAQLELSSPALQLVKNNQ
jgi:uncharacterized coiled-coil protein SlyX